MAKSWWRTRATVQEYTGNHLTLSQPLPIPGTVLRTIANVLYTHGGASDGGQVFNVRPNSYMTTPAWGMVCGVHVGGVQGPTADNNPLEPENDPDGWLWHGIVEPGVVTYNGEGLDVSQSSTTGAYHFGYQFCSPVTRIDSQGQRIAAPGRDQVTLTVNTNREPPMMTDALGSFEFFGVLQWTLNVLVDDKLGP